MNCSPVTVARETAPDLHRLPYSACIPGHPMRTIVMHVVYAAKVSDVNDTNSSWAYEKLVGKRPNSSPFPLTFLEKPPHFILSLRLPYIRQELPFHPAMIFCSRKRGPPPSVSLRKAPVPQAKSTRQEFPTGLLIEQEKRA